MPEKSREAMPEIISAKCFGCGHVVKVPAALGGKKARCPKCTNTITIPDPGESTSGEILSDEMLPEVAREGEVVEGSYVEDESAPPEASRPVERTSERRRRREGTAVRRGSSAANPRMGGRGSQQRPGPAAPKQSSTGLIIGIVVGAIALIAVAAAMAGGGSGRAGKKGPGAEKDKSKPPVVEIDPSDAELSRRCEQYLHVFNGGDIQKIMDFFDYDRSDNAASRPVRLAIGRAIEAGTRHDGFNVKSAKVTGETGTTVFDSSSAKDKTLSWKKVNGVWLIADRP